MMWEVWKSFITFIWIKLKLKENFLTKIYVDVLLLLLNIHISRYHITDIFTFGRKEKTRRKKNIEERNFYVHFLMLWYWCWKYDKCSFYFAYDERREEERKTTFTLSLNLAEEEDNIVEEGERKRERCRKSFSFLSYDVIVHFCSLFT